jgi:hypothetical protein
VQLSRLASALAFGAALLFCGQAAAQVARFDTTHTVYYEAPKGTNMFVYTPAVDGAVSPWEWLTVRAGWEADVLTGASASVKAGPAYGAIQNTDANGDGIPDVITTASVKDVRNVANGGFSIKKDTVTFDGGYSYGTENDYKSHSMNISARTELFEHNTQLQLDYARNFDRVCDRVQGVNDGFGRYRALEDSKGCWTGGVAVANPQGGFYPVRTSRGIDIDNLQGTWSQAWAPTFQTQLVYTLQVVNGFQSNPYRSVILGQGIKAQEHHPDNRTRHAVAARGNIYLKPLRAALRLGVRAYWDTWDVLSGSADIDFEKYLGERLRFTLRGRFYRQGGALFWSDDYTGGNPPLGPKGQYWTGDRELSPNDSVLVGTRLDYVLTPAAGTRKLLGFLEELKLGASFDLLNFIYEDYTLAGRKIDDARAFIVGANLGVAF